MNARFDTPGINQGVINVQPEEPPEPPLFTKAGTVYGIRLWVEPGLRFDTDCDEGRDALRKMSDVNNWLIMSGVSPDIFGGFIVRRDPGCFEWKVAVWHPFLRMWALFEDIDFEECHQPYWAGL